MAKRRTRIDFQKPSDLETTRDDRGHPEAGYQWAFCANASVEQLRQTETDQAPQTTSEAVYTFTTLWRCDQHPTTDWLIKMQARIFNIISIERIRETSKYWVFRGIEDTSPRERNPQPQE